MQEFNISTTNLDVNMCQATKKTRTQIIDAHVFCIPDTSDTGSCSSLCLPPQLKQTCSKDLGSSDRKATGKSGKVQSTEKGTESNQWFLSHERKTFVRCSNQLLTESLFVVAS